MSRYNHRLPGPISGFRYTLDHEYYHRVPQPLVDVECLDRYEIHHDRRQCAPFGVFIAYLRAEDDTLTLLGRSLTALTLQELHTLMKARRIL